MIKYQTLNIYLYYNQYNYLGYNRITGNRDGLQTRVILLIDRLYQMKWFLIIYLYNYNRN